MGVFDMKLTDEQIYRDAEPFGAFQYGDAQGHKRLAFARAIEAEVLRINGVGGEAVAKEALRDLLDFVVLPNRKRIGAELGSPADNAIIHAKKVADGVEPAIYRAAPQPQQAEPVPDGYVIVPVEPTTKMIDAGRWSEYGEESSRLRDVSDEDVLFVWQSMIDAAPKQG